LLIFLNLVYESLRLKQASRYITTPNSTYLLAAGNIIPKFQTANKKISQVGRNPELV